MRVVLINPPYFEVYKGYEKAAKIGACWPPTGLIYLSSSLINSGHEVCFLDAAAEYLNSQELLEKIEAFKPDLIGITATTPVFHRASEIAKQVKELCDIPIVIGGIHITILGEDAFRDHPEFDYAVLGEGEVTLSELASCLEKNEKPSQVTGVLLRKNGNVMATPPRPLAADLDAISYNTGREAINNKNYVWTVPGKGEIATGSIITKRGCPFLCSFCSQHSMFTRNVRYRSVENVLDELENMVKNLGITHIFFFDDTLVLKRDRIMQICEGIHKRNLKFTWEGMARANIIDKEILETMAAAGLTRMSFGIESGNQEILDNIDKGVTLDQIRQAYKWAKEAGIETRGSAIIGHPNETKETAWQTVKFLISIKHLDQVFINIMVPYPGTKVFELAKQGKAGYRLLSDDFSNYIRYNHSVLEVNDLGIDDFKRIQKLGLWLFYLTPRRLIYNLSRSGLKNGLRLSFAMLKSLWVRT